MKKLLAILMLAAFVVSGAAYAGTVPQAGSTDSAKKSDEKKDAKVVKKEHKSGKKGHKGGKKEEKKDDKAAPKSN